jgi:hypothetical protein
MDASTFVVARLNEQRARELGRDLALLEAQTARRAAVGDAAEPQRRQRRMMFRRRPAGECDPAALALAGPSS